MLHTTLTKDTLLIFCEADFKFYQRDCLLSHICLPFVIGHANPLDGAVHCGCQQQLIGL